jgi:AcrR family transcriptional regulator
MARIDATDASAEAEELTLHAPRQQRTREQWRRVLDAGVALLERDGYEGFTIAALCEQASVPPRALYARAATKDALFLAVYEHGMSRVVAARVAFETEVRRGSGDVSARIDGLVHFMLDHFLAHADFLRAVVLVSGAHPEVRRRGEAYRRELGAVFADVVTDGGREPVVEGDVDFCFSLVFSALVVRVAYGPGMGATGDAEELGDEMVRMVQRYLVNGGEGSH